MVLFGTPRPEASRSDRRNGPALLGARFAPRQSSDCGSVGRHLADEVAEASSFALVVAGVDAITEGRGRGPDASLLGSCLASCGVRAGVDSVQAGLTAAVSVAVGSSRRDEPGAPSYRCSWASSQSAVEVTATTSIMIPCAHSMAWCLQLRYAPTEWLLGSGAVLAADVPATTGSESL